MGPESSLRIARPQFNALFISELQDGYYQGGGWRQRIAEEVVLDVYAWRERCRPLLETTLYSLSGPTSFMCHAGVDRSGYLSKTAYALGLEVVPAVGTRWCLRERNLGTAYLDVNIEEGSNFVRQVNERGIYLGDNLFPTTNLVVAYDSRYPQELSDYHLLIQQLQTADASNFRLIAFDLCETALELLTMHLVDLDLNPTSLSIQLDNAINAL